MKRVLLLLCKGVEILEAGAFYDVLGWSGTDGFEVVEVVPTGFEDVVKCTFGLEVRTQCKVRDARTGDFDALAIPGGFEEYGFYEEAYSDEVANLIRQFDTAGKPVAAICVGALPVAHAGILRGRRATTYKSPDGKRRSQLAGFGADVVDALVVEDGNVITSTGPSSAPEVALRLLERLTGAKNAAQIRARMGFQPV